MRRSAAILQSDLGHQRLWFWRGWRVRYTYLSPDDSVAQQRTPMLLIHGFGASLEQWRSNLATWAQDRPVYALDLVGFGHSQKPAALLGAELWQDQVHSFWQSIINKPIILLGHSLGSLVALTAAAHHPTMVKRLILLTLPLARQDLVADWLDRLSRSVEGLFATPLLLRPLFMVVRQPRFIRRVLTKIYRRPEQVDDRLIELFTRPALERGAARTLCYLVKSRTKAEFSTATADLLSQVSIPILLLWGCQDQVLPIQWAQKILAMDEGITYQSIEGAGHCFYDELPEALDTAIRMWLEMSPV